MYPDGSLNTLEIKSDVFALMFDTAVGRCGAQWDFEACQVIANLCVLQFYEINSIACDAYRSLAKARPFASRDFQDKYVHTIKCLITSSPLQMPWLYYGFLTTETAITTLSKIPSIYVDLAARSRLDFYLGEYTMEGKFLGIRPLDNTINVCGESMDWLNIGHNVNNTCYLNLAFLAENKTETIFYELCKRDILDLTHSPSRLETGR